MQLAGMTQASLQAGDAPILKVPKVLPPFLRTSSAPQPRPVVALAAAQPLRVSLPAPPKLALLAALGGNGGAGPAAASAHGKVVAAPGSCGVGSRQPVAATAPQAGFAPVPAIVPRKSLDSEGGGDHHEYRRSEPCAFGFNCKRPDCWYAHPAGREIGNSTEAVYCRFGVRCTRPNCFYTHPEGRECEPDKYEIYLDELEMPNRPAVFPSNEEREVFVDPFPCSVDNPEFEAFTSAFGETESVFQIPGQERGYILFQEHHAARACTYANAGTWSESERCTTSRRWREHKKKGGRTHCSYPMSLPRLIAGEEAESNLVKIKEQLQLPGRLKFKTNDGPARFVGSCTAAQKEEVTRLLTELVAQAHDQVSEKLTEVYVPRGLPKGFDDDQAKSLFEGYGETESIVLTNLDKESPRHCPIARVVYKRWQDAARAQKELHQANLFDIPITCQLKVPEVGPGKKARLGNQEMHEDDDDEQACDDQEGRDAPREKRSWNAWNQRKRNREDSSNWDYGDQQADQQRDDRHRDKRRASRKNTGQRWDYSGRQGHNHQGWYDAHGEENVRAAHHYGGPSSHQKSWWCLSCGLENSAVEEVCGGTSPYLGCKEPKPC
eukprot:TRINITY_DN44413_c0_g1_i1.p1 TRINITY_DN44413_c0_g1~~TRINITY_DN44413_c0_g1_i1.p1  ORF type:complete len:607 (-),score=94.57 TRINITY_DN44413_c0_g1_i1:283-2103(-)